MAKLPMHGFDSLNFSNCDEQDTQRPDSGIHLARELGGGRTGRQYFQLPMQPGRVDFDVLYEMGDMVVEAVPEEERARYRYWRGANLGKIAMNFARGNKVLNAGKDPIAHFADTYGYAFDIANSGVNSTQYDDDDRADLAALTGKDPTKRLPSIVFALDEKNDNLYMPPSEQGGPMVSCMKGT